MQVTNVKNNFKDFEHHHYNDAIFPDIYFFNKFIFSVMDTDLRNFSLLIFMISKHTIFYELPEIFVD